jgi:hypothetical protein
VEAHLGPPAARFEADAVIAYRLRSMKRGYRVVAPAAAHPVDWKGVDFDLMVAFDASGAVSAHRLVAIHAPDAPQ